VENFEEECHCLKTVF